MEAIRTETLVLLMDSATRACWGEGHIYVSENISLDMKTAFYYQHGYVDVCRYGRPDFILGVMLAPKSSYENAPLRGEMIISVNYPGNYREDIREAPHFVAKWLEELIAQRQTDSSRPAQVSSRPD